jgi:uncharacterized protein (DUF1015 family)
MNDSYGDLGLQLPQILLPSENVDLHAWATIACDQHTSNRSYWQQVEEIVGSKPSTLRLVLPEAYLDDPDKEQRLDSIRSSMAEYVQNGTLVEHGPMAVLVERDTPEGTRLGLIMAIDLDAYDYSPDARSIIRATESTILERIPPRVSIRKGAPIELPHIMMLLDDQEKTIIEPIARNKTEDKKLYDTQLMLGGGHVRGYAVDSEQELEGLRERLAALLEPRRLRERYGSMDPLLLAVGDGNHSLAAAKTVWEELKAGGADPGSHPGRYALVEIVNLFDEALLFHPIHRVVFNVDTSSLVSKLARELGAAREVVSEGKSTASAAAACAERVEQDGSIGVIVGDQAFTLSPASLDSELPAVRVQQFLDKYENDSGELEIDYIHEIDTVSEQVGSGSNVGILLPPLDPTFLFPRIAKKGPLPRKIFSMGTSEEKRYYLEGRRILPPEQ